MNIQFFHKREDIYGEINSKGGETIALESIEPWLLDKLTIGDFFTKSVGKARCSDKENYNRKTGRDLSTSRMKSKLLTVLDITSYTTTKFLILSDNEGHIYTLQKKEGANKLHFIEYA